MTLDDALKNYTPYNDDEAEMWARFQHFLVQNAGENPFVNELAGSAPDWGHVTASAWITNSERTRFLLVYGAKAGRWLPPGAHCEGETNVLRVAQRAAATQTSVEVAPLRQTLFDLHVELIPEYRNTPPHRHYDLCFLFCADESQSLHPGANISAARWFWSDEINALNNAALARLVEKTLCWRKFKFKF